VSGGKNPLCGCLRRSFAFADTPEGIGGAEEAVAVVEVQVG